MGGTYIVHKILYQLKIRYLFLKFIFFSLITNSINIEKIIAFISFDKSKNNKLIADKIINKYSKLFLVM
jgi:hypothetical protein